MSLLAPDSYVARALSQTKTAGLQTSWFEVADFGILVLSTTEQHGAYAYPTINDVKEPGWFGVTPWPLHAVDLNGDGFEDLIARPMMVPHVVPRQTEIQPLFLMQDQNGAISLKESTDFGLSLPNKHFLNQIKSGDFNGDGIQDVALGSEGLRDLSLPDWRDTAQQQTPLVIFGGLQGPSAATDQFEGMSAEDYGQSHIMAVGDFNGDGFDDWVSGWYAFYGQSDLTFSLQRLSGVGGNAITAADFNGDGFSDIASSSGPDIGDPTRNGGDLIVMFGGPGGLLDADSAQSVFRAGGADNVGTSSIASADFDGDGKLDLVLFEHGWVTNSGDSTNYYRNGLLRLFSGDGRGGFVERLDHIIDPHAGIRQGGANVLAQDVNADGWVDLILMGGAPMFGQPGQPESLGDQTTIFLNQKGKLVPLNQVIAYVQPFQMAGFEHLEQWQKTAVPEMHPIDLGNDGLIDFLGFVQTPLGAIPQSEPIYTHAFTVRAREPLGRVNGDETLTGTMGHDLIRGFNGSDTFFGKAGDDTLVGSDGFDRAIYQGRFSDYVIMGLGSHQFSVQDFFSTRDGTDELLNIDRLQFSDVTLALDIDGIAAEAYRIYKAAFDRQPDLTGLGFWIKNMDAGVSLEAVAQEFINSAEFIRMYGADPTDEQFVDLLYANVLDRQADQSGYDFWIGALDRGLTRAGLLAEFSESRENVANVAPLIEDGIQYVAFVG
ncbi:DUF4214 domain-containing protein [Orrella daihaiensis]|uniref:DUF4214 domain-containing protein n=1 Tax=Orrella daihaiensis TaxID=2782176 RepID=A0ABY4AKA9_9BURK|nr:DUF4214 domain-containing protein [Orrella daihaiensis]UOD50403.1 DUF4214 domain-containing protein [Orrella daihaiensis]